MCVTGMILTGVTGVCTASGCSYSNELNTNRGLAITMLVLIFLTIFTCVANQVTLYKGAVYFGVRLLTTAQYQISTSNNTAADMHAQPGGETVAPVARPRTPLPHIHHEDPRLATPPHDFSTHHLQHFLTEQYRQRIRKRRKRNRKRNREIEPSNGSNGEISRRQRDRQAPYVLPSVTSSNSNTHNLTLPANVPVTGASVSSVTFSTSTVRAVESTRSNGHPVVTSQTDFYPDTSHVHFVTSQSHKPSVSSTRSNIHSVTTSISNISPVITSQSSVPVLPALPSRKRLAPAPPLARSPSLASMNLFQPTPSNPSSGWQSPTLDILLSSYPQQHSPLSDDTSFSYTQPVYDTLHKRQGTPYPSPSASPTQPPGTPSPQSSDSPSQSQPTLIHVIPYGAMSSSDDEYLPTTP